MLIKLKKKKTAKNKCEFDEISKHLTRVLYNNNNNLKVYKLFPKL